jgi:hypothetical protein
VKDYVVVVELSTEVISLGAESEQEAKDKARLIIAEQYSEGVSNDATYEVEGLSNAYL